MNTIIERFFYFIMKEKVRSFFAFACYILFIVMCLGIVLPLALVIVCFIVFIFVSPLYMAEWMEEIIEIDRRKLGKDLIKEILMYIPILIISICITSFIMVGQPANQASLDKAFYEAPILNSIVSIIIGPIIEEIIFRFLPYKFIKNKAVYIIVSAVIFAGMHVIHDPNPFYYIWFYMMKPMYYGYRYHKTKNLLVPISMHSLNNLVATLLFIF